MGEAPVQKGTERALPKKGDSRRKVQQSKVRDKRHHAPKTSNFDPENAEQRDNEISQCFHVLSNKSIKLFKKGQVVASYGLNLDVRLPEKTPVKFILNVPNDYPKSPLQLQWKRNGSSENMTRDLELQTMVRNFNYKARDMTLKRTPIIAQLNYLVYKAENLAKPGFKLIDRREREFYADFL